jgi:hypothetical protein
VTGRSTEVTSSVTVVTSHGQGLRGPGAMRGSKLVPCLDKVGFLVRQSEIELTRSYVGVPGASKPNAVFEQRLLHLLQERADRFAS